MSFDHNYWIYNLPKWRLHIFFYYKLIQGLTNIELISVLLSVRTLTVFCPSVFCHEVCQERRYIQNPSLILVPLLNLKVFLVLHCWRKGKTDDILSVKLKIIHIVIPFSKKKKCFFLMLQKCKMLEMLTWPSQRWHNIKEMLSKLHWFCHADGNFLSACILW